MTAWVAAPVDGCYIRADKLTQLLQLPQTALNLLILSLPLLPHGPSSL